jgi:hypothetical protein
MRTHKQNESPDNHPSQTRSTGKFASHPRFRVRQSQTPWVAWVWIFSVLSFQNFQSSTVLRLFLVLCLSPDFDRKSCECVNFFYFGELKIAGFYLLKYINRSFLLHSPRLILMRNPRNCDSCNTNPLVMVLGEAWSWKGTFCLGRGAVDLSELHSLSEISQKLLSGPPYPPYFFQDQG